MQFLILGADESTVSIVKTLQGTSTNRVLGWFDSDCVGDELAQLCPHAKRISDAEMFAAAVNAEATVVVGPGGEPVERERLLRDLARDGIPMIAQQPVGPGIFAVELDMIRRDTQAPIVPYHPESHQPVFARLAQWTQATDSPVGPIEQVLMERPLDDRSDQSVRGQLARDAILLRRLLGKFQSVGAMSAKETQSLANLSVQITGETTAIGRWSVIPHSQAAEATLTLVGQQGRITLAMPEQSDWQLSSTTEALPTETLASSDPADLGQHLTQAIEGQPSIPSWEDMFRSADLADVACESVRRGKTLPVSNVQLTEEDTFKSVMAAGGCLIILAIPFLLLLVSLIDGLEIPRQRTATLAITAGQRDVTLPGDVEAIESVQLGGDDNKLPVMSRQRLYETHGRAKVGAPKAYAIGRNSITLGPAADRSYQLALVYEGTFRIWRGWPLLLLSPIVFFLMLQLLKLVFPKKRDAR